MRRNFLDVFEDITKTATKIPTNEYLPNGIYPIIDQGQSDIVGYTNRKDGVFTDVPAILFGDHTRIIKYIERPCFFGADGVKLLKPKDKNANHKYLYYVLLNAKIPNTGYNRHFKWLKQINIPMYESGSQDKIVSQLDKITDLVTKRKQQLSKLDELVKARFVEMFGDPIQNTMEWTVCELSECIQFLTSGSRGWAQYFTDDGEYFITIKNVKNCRITLDDVQHIVPPNNAEAKRTKVQEGDLLISITADLGRTGIVTKEIAEHGGYINQHLTCIRLDQSVVRPLYIAYYLESEAGKCQFQSKNQSAVKAGLNFNAINSLRFMLPPIELQDRFIEFIKQTDKSKSEIQKSLEKLEMLKKALMQKYFG